MISLFFPWRLSQYHLIVVSEPMKDFSEAGRQGRWTEKRSKRKVVFSFNKRLYLRNRVDFSARHALTGYQENVSRRWSWAGEFASRAPPPSRARTCSAVLASKSSYIVREEFCLAGCFRSFACKIESFLNQSPAIDVPFVPSASDYRGRAPSLSCLTFNCMSPSA